MSEVNEAVSEPLADDVDLEPTEQVEVEQAEKAPEGYIKLEDHQKDVNKQHRKYRDEERRANKVERELQETQHKLDELKSSSVDLTIPPIPDQYDADFDVKMKARDEAVLRVAEHKAETANLEQTQIKQQQQANHDQEIIDKAKVDNFDANMVTLGLKPAEVKQAADTLIDYGISDVLGEVILEDPEGPLMATYLAQNPMELDNLNSMSAYQLMGNLDGLRQRASLLKPQTSNAPDPPDTLKGGGVPEMEDPALKGVIFE